MPRTNVLVIGRPGAGGDTLIERVLDSRMPVLGTLQAGSNDFLDAVRRDVEIIEMTEADRDGMAVVVEASVAELLR